MLINMTSLDGIWSFDVYNMSISVIGVINISTEKLLDKFINILCTG